MRKIAAHLVIFCAAMIPGEALAFELIAHRGIYQNYGRENLDAQTCTADRMLPPAHSYLENTLSSIAKAFDLGADIVELDIHPTTEAQPEQSRLVVFHDWGLACRTNATCENGCKCNEKRECNTDEQTWSYLRSLDVGYGYTADGGKTFPFQGKGVGQMPTFLAALALLSKHPNKKLLVNVKDHYERTQKLLLKELSTIPVAVRSRVLVEFQPAFAEQFRALAVPEAVWQGGGSKNCFKKLFFLGWSGYFPKPCRNLKFFVPLHQDLSIISPLLKGIKATQLIWGWPDRFLERAKQNGSEVYLSQVNSEEDFKFARSHDFSGIMTDRIELVAPLLKRSNATD